MVSRFAKGYAMKTASLGSIKFMGVLGTLTGGAVAVGVPYVVLAHGKLGGWSSVVLSLAGIACGVLLSAVSSLSSMLIPAALGTHETISQRDTITISSSPEEEYDDSSRDE